MNLPMRDGPREGERGAQEVDEPIALHERAMDDLRYIRNTMARVNSFTAVPGWGGVVAGVLALIAAFVASVQPTALRWITVWLVAAALAVANAAVMMVKKARRADVALVTGPGRTFLLSFLPPVIVAMILTAALYLESGVQLMPGLWMLSFGAAVIAAGTFSVRVVPMMGIAFMVVGALALVTPHAWGDVWMAVGFGGLEIGFGLLIARRHGG